MVKRVFLIIGSMIVLILLPACSGEGEQAKSMEQIYKEEGVPVKIAEIKPQHFEKMLTYHAVLTGIEESTVSAQITDRVERVLVNIGDYVKKDQVLITFPMDNPSAQYQQISNLCLVKKTCLIQHTHRLAIMLHLFSYS